MVARDSLPPPPRQVALAALQEHKDVHFKEVAAEVARLLGAKGSLEESRRAAADANLPVEDRRAALHALAMVRDRESLPAFHAALDHPELRLSTLRELIRMPGTQGTERILELYREFTPDQKQAALAAISTRPDDALLAVKALAQGTIARSEITPYLARQLLAFDLPEIREGLAAHWGTVTTTPENERAEMAAWQDKLSPDVLQAGNLENGKALYTQRCATCHILFGEGQAIGPDLTGANRGDLGYLLENIISPNSAIGQDYQLNMVTLTDGQVVSGLVVEQSGEVLKLRTLADTHLVARNEIAKHEVLPVSMMPPGLFTGLSDEEVRDLIAYLQGARP